MMGVKGRDFRQLPEGLSLEALVPRDNFYRCLEERIDLSFVRELVLPLYARGGRHSSDPVVFFKLQLVLFFENLRSERRLMEVVADRLSLRWYVGYDLHEPLPDHSSLTKIRERYGTKIFRNFFERIVEMCVQAGLVRGEELLFDATKVEADAAVDSLAPRWFVEAHLSDLFDEDDDHHEGEEERQGTGSGDEATYICPAGETLRALGEAEDIRSRGKVVTYRARGSVCAACSPKPRCTTNKNGRSLRRSPKDEYIDLIRAYMETEPYQKALRKRKVWIEPLFAEGKLWHGMRPFRTRTLDKVNAEALMTATDQNIKRLLAFGHRGPKKSAQAVSLRPPDRLLPDLAHRAFRDHRRKRRIVLRFSTRWVVMVFSRLTN